MPAPKTYAQEKAEKDAAKAKRAKKYVYDPVPFDAMKPLPGLTEGQVVVKTQPHGCPKNGTMGMCYVADTEGKFLGMVCLNSLKPAKESAVVAAYAALEAPAADAGTVQAGDYYPTPGAGQQGGF